jgi:hypothetical protein
MAPQSLLCAAVTIVVKKRLVNSITFSFYFLGSGSAAVAAHWQRWRRLQHSGGGQLGGRGSSLAEARFRGSSSVFGNAAAAWWWGWQQRCVGGSSMAYADNNFNLHDDDDD